MEKGEHQRTHPFLVRLWIEELGAGEVEWRGKVQNIATGDLQYFRDWPGLIAVLQKMLQKQPAEPEQAATDS